MRGCCPAVLASTFLLYSIGLGAGAIPTAGALNWVMKDGLGQFGTLLFGKAIAHNFDIYSKTWYFLSSVQLSLATGLEILTVAFPQHFLMMGSVANMVKGAAHIRIEWTGVSSAALSRNIHAGIQPYMPFLEFCCSVSILLVQLVIVGPLHRASN